MKFIALPLTFSVLLLLAPRVHGGETDVQTLPFTRGVERFDGSARHDPDVGHDGKGALRLAADFTMSRHGKVSCTRYLRLKRPVREVVFQVRSTTANRLDVRWVDATAQKHLQHVRFRADGKWHPIRVTQFAGDETWHGAADGTFYMPPRRLRFILKEDHVVAGQEAEVWVDDLRIVQEPEADGG